MTTLRQVLAIVLAASALTAQTSGRTYHLNTVADLTGLNEIASAVHYLVDLEVTVDSTRRDLTINGTADQLALASWLIQHLDSPAAAPEVPKYEAGGRFNPTVAIFYLAHLPTRTDLLEFVTILRTVGDIQLMCPYSAAHAVVIRTTTDKVQFAEWLVKQLDVTPDKHVRTARYDLPTNKCADGVAEVAFLSRQLKPSGLNCTVTALRTVADIQHIFTRSSTPEAIAFSGCLPQVQLAEWIMQQVDAPSDADARLQKREYKVTGSADIVARVYYPKSNDVGALNAMVSAIRSETRATKILFCAETRALVLRAAPDAVSVADRIIQERDR